MNRKLVVVVALAAVLALLAGAWFGRNLLSSATPSAAQRPDVVRFKDDISKISIAYPASWTRLPNPANDPEVSLLAAADDSASLLMRSAQVGLAKVTTKTLPIVRKFTDDLVAADPRVKQLFAPQAVEVGGLPGWRYRYSYGSGTSAGAHDHYFLFKGTSMIQLVFQAVPVARLTAVAPVFDSIAATFRGNER